ncbi:Aldo-keto reductase family 1 member B1 [Frankliniella fusca]|uniref:Aldo-keto reductase family 1 member B1 n=1 Tax=Frankliniella fusca TaxID=407009 RepID=A0AAE1LIJ5_9NEOP|nr:Aldo-keto reductase family 1 member B1 [Frankliniella fusca]
MTEGQRTFAIHSDYYSAGLAGRTALKEPTSLLKSALSDVKNILQARQTPTVPIKRIGTFTVSSPRSKSKAIDVLPDSLSQYDLCNCNKDEEDTVGLGYTLRLESECLREEDILYIQEGMFKLPNSEDAVVASTEFPDYEPPDADESFLSPARSLDSYFPPVDEPRYIFDFED